MPIKEMVLKYAAKAFIAAYACSLAVFVAYMLIFASEDGSIVAAAVFAVVSVIIFVCAFVLFKMYVDDKFKITESKMKLMLERLDYNEDFAAISMDIDEIDNLAECMNKRLNRENLDFSDFISEKRNIQGVFKLNYNTGKFVFSFGLVDFLGVKEYEQEGNICVADLNAYYDFTKNIGKSFSEDEDNLYYEDTAEGRMWFNIFLKYSGNCGYGFIADATDRIVALDFDKIKSGKGYSSGKFQSADIMAEVLRKKLEEEKKAKGCLISADLALIRTINENYGYNTGNEYIKTSERAVRENFSDAVVGKKSAFEYYIFIFTEADGDIFKKVERKFNTIYEREFFVAPDGKHFRIKFNVGYAKYPQDTNSVELLFKYSAYALYEARKFYNIPINSFSLKNYNNDAYMELKFEKIESLIRNNEVYYEFQPVVSLRNGAVTAYEALMRPKDEMFISPVEVIELVKNKNLSYRFERMTVWNCLEIADKNRKVFKNKRLLYNTIGMGNLKPEDLAPMYEKYSDIGHALVPEVEEIANLSQVLSKCVEIHEKGDKFAVDKFTAKSEGYENIFRIKPTYVKIDRDIIADINLKPQKQAFLANLVRIAKNHDVSLIAIGVETTDELREIIRLGVDFAQGYYFAKPKQEFVDRIDGEIIEEIEKYNGIKR